MTKHFNKKFVDNKACSINISDFKVFSNLLSLYSAIAKEPSESIHEMTDADRQCPCPGQVLTIIIPVWRSRAFIQE